MDIDCVFSTLLYCNKNDAVNCLSTIKVFKCINNNYLWNLLYERDYENEICDFVYKHINKYKLHYDLIKLKKQLNLSISIKDLSTLTNLSVKFCKLIGIPDIIFQLKKLDTLNLTNNQLETLMFSTPNITNLKSLYINYNQVTTISTDLLKLKSLTIFSITNTLLTIIPKEISELCELNILILSNNSIRSIPSELGKLSKLTYLDLSNNMLSSIPPELGNLKQLITLNVKNNPLEIIKRTPSDPFYILENHFENKKLLALPNEIHCIPFVQIQI